MFNLVGFILILMGLTGLWAVLREHFSKESLVLVGTSLGCLGLGAELLHAGIKGRKFGAWDWWLP